MSGRSSALWFFVAALALPACVTAPDAPESWSADVRIESAPDGARIVWFPERTPVPRLAP